MKTILQMFVDLVVTFLPCNKYFLHFFKSINTCTGIIVVGNTVLCKEQIKMSLFSWHWLQGYSKIHLDYRFSVFMDLKVNAQHL